MLLSRWGGSDPKAALAYAQELVLRGEIVIHNPTTRDFRIAHFSMTPLFDSWLKKDFSAAKAWVEGLPADSWFRKGLLPSLAFDMAQKDPVAALNLARSLSGVERESFLSGAIDGWSLKDADAAIAYVGQLPASQNKISIIESMIGTLASKNPDKAINLLAAIPPGDVQNQALSKIANAWAQSDPKAAIDWANQQTNPELKSQILEGVISGMAKKDPNAALELAQLLTKGDDSRENISNILSDLAESDPKGAVDYAMNLPSSKNRNMMIGNLAGQWITVDPEGALGWYASLTDPNLKGRVAVSMIVNLSPVDPDRAINLLVAMPPGDAQNEALSTIGYYWDRTDQNAALDWANQQIDPEVKSRILEGVIAGMSAKNPNSAFQLAQSLPAGNSRNKSINLSLGSMAQSDPQSAIGLASGIADADLRSKAQQNIVLIWKRRDPAAATQWVNSSTLPQDVKARLLKEK
jgi:hypothetical protein